MLCVYREIPYVRFTFIRSVYHLSGISREMFRTKGTALFLSKEINRIEAYQLIVSFEISAGLAKAKNRDY